MRHPLLVAAGFTAALFGSFILPSSVYAQPRPEPPLPVPPQPGPEPEPGPSFPEEQPPVPVPPPVETEPVPPQPAPEEPEQLEDGGRIVVSGTSWKGINNPPSGWEHPSFDDSEWPQALVGFARRVSEDARFSPDNFLGHETRARWIWARTSADCGLRTSFELEELPDRAELWIACDDKAIVWCNGDPVGVWSTAGNWGRLDAGASLLDLRPYLRTGRNVIAVLAHDDWIKRGMLAEIRIDAPPLAPHAAPAAPTTDAGRQAVLDVIRAVAEAQGDDELAQAMETAKALGRGALWAIAAQLDAVEDRQTARGRLEALRREILVADGLSPEPMPLAKLHRAIAGTDDTRWRRMALWVFRDMATWPREALLAQYEAMLDTTNEGRQADLITLAGHLGLTELAQAAADLLATTESEDLAKACIGALAYIGDKRHAKAVMDAANRFDHPMICGYGVRIAKELADREAE